MHKQEWSFCDDSGYKTQNWNSKPMEEKGVNDICPSTFETDSVALRVVQLRSRP